MNCHDCTHKTFKLGVGGEEGGRRERRRGRKGGGGGDSSKLGSLGESGSPPPTTTTFEKLWAFILTWTRFVLTESTISSP